MFYKKDVINEGLAQSAY